MTHNASDVLELLEDIDGTYHEGIDGEIDVSVATSEAVVSLRGTDGVKTRFRVEITRIGDTDAG